MSLSSRTNSKLLRVFNLTLVASLGNVPNAVLLCCGLAVALKALPSCWRWATHLAHRGRLRDQTLKGRDPEPDDFAATNLPEVPYGLQILHSDPKATVDIVAVHGLGANPKYAWVWSPKNGPVNWLVDCLPEKIPFPYRVMTFNYDSKWHYDAPKQRLSLISNELLTRLRNEREKDGTADRPLIFIGHSFGGNVIEQAIVSATKHESPHSTVARSTVGVIFLGTPHRGSKPAELGVLIARTAEALGAITEDRILNALKEHSDTFTDLLHDFSCWAFRCSVPVVCFFEQRETDYGRRLGIIRFKQWVVTEYSACIDGHIRVGLLKDHLQINKYSGPDDPSFQLVYPEISKMARDAKEKVEFRRNPRAIPLDDSATLGTLQQCLRAALLRDPRDDLASIQRQKGKRVGRTCEWLLGNEIFTAWVVSRNPQLLRLVGSPGIGKTMMSTFLVQELQKKTETAPNTIFAYFFCDNKHELRRTETSILRSVIRQLLLQKHALFNHIQSDFEDRGSDLFEDFDALWRILEKMLKDHCTGEIFVLVDGFDECDISARKGLLRSLPDLFDSQQTGPTGKFKFLITSRPEADIENALKDVGASLRIDSGKINSDLREYIDTKVENLRKIRRYTPRTTETVQNTLKAKTGATFLWVSLMLAELENPETDQDEVEKKLESLPIGLNDAYARILGQIREEKRDRAQFLLRLMVAARRPLKKYEIATAFAMWKNDSIPQRQELDTFTGICSSCKSIVYLDVVDESGDVNSTVNFLHQSVKDFLLEADVQWYHTSPDGANLFMFQVCWKYLSMEEFEYGNLIIRRETGTEMGQLRNAASRDLQPHFQEHLFLEYASKEWKVHAVSSYPALLGRFEIDLQKASTLRDAWLLLAAREGQEEVLKLLLRGGADPAARDEVGRTPLSWAAWRGHCASVKLLLEKAVDVDSKDRRYGQTPLSWAAGGGHEAVVKLLLEKAVDVDSRDKSGHTPLTWAAIGGHEAVVKLLFEKSADVDSKDKNGQTPLSWAAEGGHEAVVKLLLEKAADVDSTDHFGRTPLSWAAKSRNEMVVKLLLERSVGVDSRDGNGRTPLSWAAAGGFEAAVKLLLEKAVDMESKDKNGQTPLSWAAKGGHEAAVKLLPEKAIDVDSKDHYGRTPLSWAAMGGCEAVVKLLLEKAADVDSRDNMYGQTPLACAAEGGHEAVVKLLLEKAVDVDSMDRFDQTPLSWAAKSGNEMMVKLLLEKSADVDSRDKNSQTPLSWAAMMGREAVVKLLLEKAVDVDPKDKDGRTPLSWAARGGREAVVKLLLEKAVDVDSRDNIYGRTPLSWAVEGGHEAVVKLLLEKAVDVNSKDRNSRTPLSWAVEGGHEAVVKLLLEKAVDVDSKDNMYGQTPLSLAAGEGHEAVTKLLLEKAVDVDSKDRNSRTPLSWAVEGGHEAVVKLLLEKFADVDSKDNMYGQTPLSWAAGSGNEVLVKLLLEKSVDVDSRDNIYGRTPLSWAARGGREAVVKLLLEKAVDVDSKDKDGRTPLSWAAEEGYEAVVRLLLEKAADVDSKDKSGRTPLSLATDRGHEAVVKLLESKT